jgi:hypothetical protein
MERLDPIVADIPAFDHGGVLVQMDRPLTPVGPRRRGLSRSKVPPDTPEAAQQMPPRHNAVGRRPRLGYEVVGLEQRMQTRPLLAAV